MSSAGAESTGTFQLALSGSKPTPPVVDAPASPMVSVCSNLTDDARMVEPNMPEPSRAPLEVLISDEGSIASAGSFMSDISMQVPT